MHFLRDSNSNCAIGTSGCFLDAFWIRFDSTALLVVNALLVLQLHAFIPSLGLGIDSSLLYLFATCLFGSILFRHIFAQFSAQSIQALNLGTERKEPGPRRRPTPSLLTAHSNMSVIQLEEYGFLSICITASH